MKPTTPGKKDIHHTIQESVTASTTSHRRRLDSPCSYERNRGTGVTQVTSGQQGRFQHRDGLISFIRTHRNGFTEVSRIGMFVSTWLALGMVWWRSSWPQWPQIKQASGSHLIYHIWPTWVLMLLTRCIFYSGLQWKTGHNSYQVSLGVLHMITNEWMSTMFICISPCWLKR